MEVSLKNVLDSQAESNQGSPTTPTEPGDLLEHKAQLESLDNAIKAASASAARQATRQNWRKCLTGNAHDESYFIRAILKFSDNHIFKRIVQHHGDQLLEVAKDDFLDKALELRLRSISAPQLVTMLAKAQRLGYDESDIIEANEMVVPKEDLTSATKEDLQKVLRPVVSSRPEFKEKPIHPSPAQQHYRNVHQSPDSDQRNLPQPLIQNTQWRPQQVSHSQQVQNGSVSYPASDRSSAVTISPAPALLRTSSGHICRHCGTILPTESSLKQHLDSQVCRKQPKASPQKYTCQFCGQGFTTNQGRSYHIEKKVCLRNKAMSDTRSASPSILAYHPAPFQHAPPIGHPALQEPAYSHFPTHHQPHALLPAGPQNSTQPQPLRFQSPASVSQLHPNLSPERLRDMNAKLALEDLKFDSNVKNLPESITAFDRDEQIRKFKASLASRKSLIRKFYGVQRRKGQDVVRTDESVVAGPGTGMLDTFRAGPIPAMPAAARPATNASANAIFATVSSTATLPATAMPTETTALGRTHKANSPATHRESKRQRISGTPKELENSITTTTNNHEAAIEISSDEGNNTEGAE